MMLNLLFFIDWLLQLLELLIIVMAIASWLIAFDVLNLRNQAVRSTWAAMNALLDPLLRPIRAIVPVFGGLDLSPLVLIVLIEFARKVLVPAIAGVLV